MLRPLPSWSWKFRNGGCPDGLATLTFLKCALVSGLELVVENLVACLSCLFFFFFFVHEFVDVLLEASAQR